LAITIFVGTVKGNQPMRRMRVFLASIGVAALLGIGLIAPAGAYWVVDPGPHPDRCQRWYDQIQAGGMTAASAQRYFDLYNCVWVDEGEEGAEEAPSDGGASVRR